MIVPLFLFVYTSAQLYLWLQFKRYLRDRVDGWRWGRAVTYLGLVLFILISFPLAWRLFFGVSNDQPHHWLWYAALSGSLMWGIGSVGSAFILLIYNVFRRFNLFFHRKPMDPALDSGRRNFLSKGIQLAAAAPFGFSAYSVLVERRRFQLEHFDVPVAGLSSALSQLTIAQLTDIHVGPFMSPDELAEYVEAVNRLRPDLIALTGDFVTGSESEVLPCAETLGGLKARYGVFACMGNHDIYARATKELTRLFAARGIRVLSNDAAMIQVGATALSVLGIDDLKSGRPDLKRALAIAGQNMAEARVLLSHRPEIFPAAAQQGMDLVLSGHYHGGQVKLTPDAESLSIARFLTPYAEGMFQLSHRLVGDRKHSTLFVSRGIGISGLPIRINCPPQIAHLTLRRA